MLKTTTSAFAATAALTVALAMPAEADAGTKKSDRLEKQTASSPACTAKSLKRRVPFTVLFDVESGENLYSSLPEDRLDTTAISPASLTKLEFTREVLDRVKAGELDPDQRYGVVVPKGGKAKLTLRQIVQASLVTSYNFYEAIATPAMIRSMQERMARTGLLHSHYVSPTGNPDGPANEKLKVRDQHVTTIGDLKRSVRAYKLETTEDVTSEILGLKKISGLPQLNIPSLVRKFNTISILEDATGKTARPYPGVNDSKSGYTCEFGFGGFVNLQAHGRNFIVLTGGHATPRGRDAHFAQTLDAQRQTMQNFAEAKRQAVPLMTSSPLRPVASLPPVTQELPGHDLRSGMVKVVAPPEPY